MKNNKLNASNSAFKRFSSTDLVITQQVFPTSSKNRYVSQNPLIFSLQSKNINKFDSFSQKPSTYYGVFSMDKPNYTKIRQQRQDFQKLKSKSFNIKKIIDKSIKEGQIVFKQKKFAKAQSKQFVSKQADLESNVWRKYVQPEFKEYELSKQLMNLNKNLGVIINRSANSKSELIERRNSRLLYKNDRLNEESLERNFNKERNTYFVNNFIKTKIKRKPKIEQNNIFVNLQSKKSSELNVVGKGDLHFEGNWVVPWQKSHETQQDTFMQS